MRLIPIAAIFCGSLWALSSTCPAADPETGPPNDARARRFVRQHEAAVNPLEIQCNLLGWNAEISGKEDDFRKKQAAEEKLDRYLADAGKFAELKAIREAGLSDPLLARQIDVLYRQYLPRQVPVDLLEKISAKENEIQRKFNVFRPKFRDKTATDNELRRILNESRDSDELRAAWEAGKQVGPVVLDDLKELVALRNQAARRLGFSDFHAMRLFLGELDRDTLLKLFDELDELTRGPFLEAKAEMDAALAGRYGIAVEGLRPWHYQDPFFQEPPAVPGALPEAVYKPLDTVGVCRKFFAGIGLPVDDVLARSDLYEKPGKNPHAFSTDIDRSGDVRIFENVVPGCEWLGTTLHELGHAVYSKGISRDLPYTLRNDAHPLTTEGVAMMFERFARNVDWLRAMGADVPEPGRYRAAMAQLRRNRLLVFARWAQVMVRFESALYADPDQDLNRLWWDLVEKYQGLKRPEGRDAPDFAAKYHVVGAPAYYHNYMLGEMFASQLNRALSKKIGAIKWNGGEVEGPFFGRPECLVGNKAVGEFLRRRVFEPGTRYPWNEMVLRATGEELSPKALAEDIKTQIE